MKYKALLLDVDGTLIRYDYFSLPSDRVIEAVKKAQEKLTVCLVTGRAYGSLVEIFDSIGMDKGYAVLDGGAHVMELATKELLYDQPLDRTDVEKVLSIFEEEDISPVFVKRNLYDLSYLEPYKKGESLDGAFMIFTGDNYPEKKMDMIAQTLSSLPHLAVHKSRHKNPNTYGFNITHVNATKAHGVEVLMKKLNLKKEEIIGVGDGYNDFPLLMASGLKVAMGNANEELKSIADYVASDVNDDGVAEVIEKFIL